MGNQGFCLGLIDPLGQRSPTLLAPGTGFVEDSFSTVGAGRGTVQVADEALLTQPPLTSGS